MSEDVTYPAAVKMQESAEIDKLAAALAKAQGTMTGAAKDAANPFYNSRYASLAQVWDTIRHPLADNGLSVTQMVETDATPTRIRVVHKDRQGTPHALDVDALRVGVKTRLMHESGQYLESTMTVLSGDASIQAVGSAISYVRRYALMAACGVAPDDDDGNAAQPKPHEERTSDSAGLTRGAQRGADWLAANGRPSTAQEVDSQKAAAAAIDKQMTKTDAKTLTKRARCLRAAAEHGLIAADIGKVLAELGWPDAPKDLSDEQIVALETTKFAEYAARLAGAPAVMPDGSLSALGAAAVESMSGSEYLADPEEEVA